MPGLDQQNGPFSQIPVTVSKVQLGYRYIQRQWIPSSTIDEFTFPWKCVAIGPSSSWGSVLIKPPGWADYMKIGVGAPLVGNFAGQTLLKGASGSAVGGCLELLFYDTGVPPFIPIKRPIYVKELKLINGNLAVANDCLDVQTPVIVDQRKRVTMGFVNREAATIYGTASFYAQTSSLDFMRWNSLYDVVGGVNNRDELYRFDQFLVGTGAARTYDVPVGAEWMIPVDSSGNQFFQLANVNSQFFFFAED